MQTFDDGLLGRMERLRQYGNGATIRDRLAAARGVFPTLNVDMIFNLPGQTLAQLDRDLDVLLDLQVDQVSFYPLMTAPSARLKMERSMGRSDRRSAPRDVPSRRRAPLGRLPRRFGLVLFAQ